MFRRRPLMRAAVVGGGAYVVGKQVQQSRQHTAEQDAQLASAQAPQAAPAASQDDKMAELKQLKELLDTGVLTQAEFDAQKQKILQSM